MLIAARQSWRSGIWPLNSLGVSERLALYSGYSRVRKDCREVSNATARWVGCSALMRLISIDEEPVDPVRVLAVLRREVVDGQRVERPIRQRMAVHDEKGRLCGVRHPAQPSQGVRQAPTPPERGPAGDPHSPRRPMSDDASARRRARMGARSRHGRPRREDGLRVGRVHRSSGASRRCRSRATPSPSGSSTAARTSCSASRSARCRQLHAGPGRLAVGIDINATHTRSATSGHRDRRLHADPPRPQHHGARDRRDRRSGPPLLDRPDHEHDPRPAER